MASRTIGSVAGMLLFLVACAGPRDRPAEAFVRVRTGEPVTDRGKHGGVSWIDFDGDGDDDLFVANGYDVSADEPVPQKNRLYENRGDGRLVPAPPNALTEDEGFSSGSTWGDWDRDGDLDVFVPNQRDQDNALYRNDGGTLLRADGGDLGRAIGFGSTVAWADLDQDGGLDLYIGHWPNEPGPGENNLLFVNRGPRGHWLGIRLRGGDSDTFGIGARVSVVAGAGKAEGGPGGVQVREVAAHAGWRSQNSLVQHFGLGDRVEVDEVVVRWPSGTVDRLEDVPADRVIEIVEGETGAGETRRRLRSRRGMYFGQFG